LTGRIVNLWLLLAIARTYTIGIYISLNNQYKFGRMATKIKLIKLNGTLLDGYLQVVVAQKARFACGGQSNHSPLTFSMILGKKSTQFNGVTYRMATYSWQLEVKLDS
jgi:hypothetical protein